MKHYKQGDQRTFTSDMEEYKNLEDFAKMLTKNSPNRYMYVVQDVYLDIGQDWKWTTIVNETTGVQIYPTDWFEIVNKDRPFTEIMKDFFEKYNDK